MVRSGWLGKAVLAVLGMSGLCGCLACLGLAVRVWLVRVWFVRARPVAEWSGSWGEPGYDEVRWGMVRQSRLVTVQHDTSRYVMAVMVRQALLTLVMARRVSVSFGEFW